MTDLQTLLDGRPGIYRLSAKPEALETALVGAGWRTAVVPGSDSTAGFYRRLATALQLPGHFGRNLDALWDSLTDLAEPTAVVLADWTRYAQARPERWAAILAVLVERTEALPPFAVVLAD